MEQPDASTAVSAPPCKHLRTKASYVPAMRHVKPGMPPSLDAHYWCNHTMKPIGPDHDFVCVEDCVPGRKCYEV